MDRDDFKKELLNYTHKIEACMDNHIDDSFLFLLQDAILYFKYDNDQVQVDALKKKIIEFIDKNISLLFEEGYYYMIEDEAEHCPLLCSGAFFYLYKNLDLSDNTKTMIKLKYGEFDEYR